MDNLHILSARTVDPATGQEWTGAIPASMKRRDPRIWQLAYAASKRAIDAAGVQPKSIVCGTALGALDETRGYLDGIFKDGFGSPRHFIASVHNSMAGKIALEFKIDGPNLTVCEGQNSFASTIATCSLLSECDFPSLLLIIDENIELLKLLNPHLSKHCRQCFSSSWSEAAVAFVVTRDAAAPCFTACGPCCRTASSPAETCKDIVKREGLDASRLPSLEQTSDSFLKPALCAQALLDAGTKGTHLIGSYSPSADAAAVVFLCL